MESSRRYSIHSHLIGLVINDLLSVQASTVQDLPTSLQDKTSRKAAKMYAAMPANGLQLKSARRNQQNIQQLKRITVKVDDMNAAQAVVRLLTFLLDTAL